jgi:hypothetical protein
VLVHRFASAEIEEPPVMMAKAKEAASLGAVGALADQVGRKPRRDLDFLVIL